METPNIEKLINAKLSSAHLSQRATIELVALKTRIAELENILKYAVDNGLGLTQWVAEETEDWYRKARGKGKNEYSIR